MGGDAVVWGLNTFVRDTLEGKPTRALELSGPDGGAIDLVALMLDARGDSRKLRKLESEATGSISAVGYSST